MPEYEIRPTAGGDWVVGVSSSYVPCPKHCGRMVADTIGGLACVVAPCTRCQRLALLIGAQRTIERDLVTRYFALDRAK